MFHSARQPHLTPQPLSPLSQWQRPGFIVERANLRGSRAKTSSIGEKVGKRCHTEERRINVSLHIPQMVERPSCCVVYDHLYPFLADDRASLRNSLILGKTPIDTNILGYPNKIKLISAQSPYREVHLVAKSPKQKSCQSAL